MTNGNIQPTEVCKYKSNGVGQFFLNILSSCLGSAIAGIIVLIIGIAIIAALFSSEDVATEVKPNSILRIPLGGMMVEKENDNSLAALLGDSDPEISLESILNAISIAKENPNIKGISLEAGMLMADPASLQEIFLALEDFKKSKKFIYAYGDHYTQGAYFVCSAADRIMLNPSGEVDWKGLGSQVIFYKDLLAKLGIQVQVFKVGTFKSAVEPYTLTKMSEANRNQVNSLLQGVWHEILSAVSSKRHISATQLNAMADQYVGLMPADSIKKLHLVDELMYRDDYEDFLKGKAGISDDKDLAQITPAKLCLAYPKRQSDKAIAIVYAEGDIVDYKEMGLVAESAIDVPTMSKTLKKLTKDNNIKAVVLRINSGGGSAYASEQLWHSLKKLSEKKPLIISMGGAAASGAYYMSVAGNMIFSEPTTLTGSIGIFGLIPDASELLTDKLGLNFDDVKTNAMSDFGNLSRPFNDKEKVLMQNYIDNGYQLFLNRVSQGRKIPLAKLDTIAQGRVWTGLQAKKLGLVDRIGTLQDAINEAAKRAKIQNDYTIQSYPESEPWFETLGLSGIEAKLTDKKLRAVLGEYYEPFKATSTLRRQHRIQARMPYIISIK